MLLVPNYSLVFRIEVQDLLFFNIFPPRTSLLRTGHLLILKDFKKSNDFIERNDQKKLKRCKKW